MARVLIVDDDPVILEVVGDILKKNGYEVVDAPSGAAGMRELERKYFDLVLTDLVMPDVDGMEVLEHVVSTSPKAICIILTGHGTIKSSVVAIKKGAFDYITKPITAD